MNFKLNHNSLIYKWDPLLASIIAVLIFMGLVMVTSASIGIAERRFHEPFYYAWHQAAYLGLGLLGGMIALKFPMSFWYKMARIFAILAFIVLGIVLIPGIGRNVNGATRWLDLGFITIQISEFVKLSIIIYLASYIGRQKEVLQYSLLGFMRPMFLLAVIGGLLLLQPDFGATVIITTTAMAMLFLAGVPLRYFAGLSLMVALALVGLAVSAPYRLQRMTAFLDPWAYQFDSGYQLTQALIAFGRGEWFGVGLGSSVQKLFYLPEAHTDFVFAVLAEELGLVGAVFVIILFVLLITRGVKIAYTAENRGAIFEAFVSYGIVLWIGIQALVNVGVNTGVLPTKGLTLPFISYGGSSILTLCLAISLVFRVDFENRQHLRREAGIEK